MKKIKNVNDDGWWKQIRYYIKDNNIIFYCDGANSKGIAKGHYYKSNGIPISDTAFATAEETILQCYQQYEKVYGKYMEEIKTGDYEQIKKIIRDETSKAIETILCNQNKLNDVLIYIKKDIEKLVTQYKEIIDNYNENNSLFKKNYYETEYNTLSNYLKSL